MDTPYWINELLSSWYQIGLSDLFATWGVILAIAIFILMVLVIRWGVIRIHKGTSGNSRKQQKSFETKQEVYVDSVERNRYSYAEIALYHDQESTNKNGYHECGWCSFLESKDSLLPEYKEQRTRSDYWLCVLTRWRYYKRHCIDNCGVFVMDNWVKHATFYSFECWRCKKYQVDFIRSSNEFLRCSCGAKLSLSRLRQLWILILNLKRIVLG